MKTISNYFHVYSRLIRIDKPIGIFLLLWPTLWALWLASKGEPTLHHLVVFVVGVFFMRSAGCVINDFADRHFDAHISRTCNRPFAQGEITEKEAKVLFCSIIFVCFLLVLTLNYLAIFISFVALVLAWVYPFMKRITYLPQFILGLAYSSSIPMVYAATLYSLPLSCWLLFLANICWTVAYDTQYAMVDREDDIKIGIKSTAVLFGKHSQIVILLLQIIFFFLIAIVGLLAKLTFFFYISLLILLFLFCYQYLLLRTNKIKNYFNAFLNNNLVGFVIFFGIFCSYLQKIIL